MPNGSTFAIPKFTVLSHHSEIGLGGKYFPETVSVWPFCTNKDVARLVLLPNNPAAMASLIWVIPLRYSEYGVVELDALLLLLSCARKTMLSYKAGLSPAGLFCIKSGAFRSKVKDEF
jgi:hypothetical protein